MDSLGHSGLKNKGLPPGGGLGCFQSSQDIVHTPASRTSNRGKVSRFRMFKTIMGLSYTLLDQVFSSISLDQDFYEKVIPGVGFHSPLLVWIKIFPRNLV